MFMAAHDVFGLAHRVSAGHAPQESAMRDPRHAPVTVTPTDEALCLFTCEEWVALLLLRRRYHYGQDLWDAHEFARLSFLRWLREMGRSES